ncbi:MAG: D-aminoacyl-tRNA deacylase [Brevinemataceae bacterium]
MIVLVRKVLSASVTVEYQTISSIGFGLLLYVGFEKFDHLDDCIMLAEKTVRLRIFDDENGTVVSISDLPEAGILSVSQFTLSAETKKGLRPSFSNAMSFDKAQEFYNFFNQQLQHFSHKQIKEGIFGADMKISAVDDGPFTILLKNK